MNNMYLKKKYRPFFIIKTPTCNKNLIISTPLNFFSEKNKIKIEILIEINLYSIYKKKKTQTNHKVIKYNINSVSFQDHQFCLIIY